jgi:hypothetical protein
MAARGELGAAIVVVGESLVGESKVAAPSPAEAGEGASADAAVAASGGSSTHNRPSAPHRAKAADRTRASSSHLPEPRGPGETKAEEEVEAEAEAEVEVEAEVVVELEEEAAEAETRAAAALALQVQWRAQQRWRRVGARVGDLGAAELAACDAMRAAVAAARQHARRGAWQEPSEEEVRGLEIFHRGLQANREGQTSRACALMEEAAALRPRLNVLLSLANMQLKQGQPAAALLAYQATLRAPRATARELAMARRKMDEVTSLLTLALALALAPALALALTLSLP